MPNDYTAVCGCVLDKRELIIHVPEASNGSGKGSSSAGKGIEGRPAMKKPSELEQQRTCRGYNGRSAADYGSSSSIADQSTASRRNRSNKKDKRSARRSRSAERPESHYTYIDSGSSILGSGIRENAMAEALYCTIDGDDEPPQQQQQQQQSSTNVTGSSNNGSGQQPANTSGSQNNRPQQPIYAVPSMTSPPPTYDVAVAKSWQLGLPPSYEEYLYHKHALLSRSHTPPPPWTDSANGAGSSHQFQLLSRELLANGPELPADLREYLQRLTIQHSAEEAIIQHYQQLISQQQALRKQAARTQRSRAMPPRSQSESRANQQRIACEDGAFCMETTALQSAFENGVAFCSLM